MVTPIATEMSSHSVGKMMETAATALAPSLPTQNMSAKL